MSDSFTTTTSESWFSRIKSSIGGIFIGLIMMLIALPVLFFNEGRAVKTSKSLKEGASAVVDVPASPINTANNGKLVHFSGMTNTAATLKDSVFGVEAKALTLARTVEMYQWKETSKSTSKEKVGGGKETTTTYDYEKEWASSPVASANFKRKEGHENPSSFPYKAQTLAAKDVTVGDFKIPERVVAGLAGSKPMTLDDAALASAPGTKKPKMEDGAFYYGDNPGSAQIGDVRVKFSSLAPTDISVLAAQNGNTIAPYQTKAGRALETVQTGSATAAEMFANARKGNTMLTWALRFTGWLLMFLGLTMLFKPLVMIGKVVPFIGSIVAAGTGLISFVIASVISLVVVAIAWIVYRPLLGIILLVVAAALAVFAAMKIKAAEPGALTASRVVPAV